MSVFSDILPHPLLARRLLWWRHVIVERAVRRNPVGLEFRTARLQTLGLPLAPLEVEARLPHALLKTWKERRSKRVRRTSSRSCSNRRLLPPRRHVRHAQVPHASVFNVSFFEPIKENSQRNVPWGCFQKLFAWFCFVSHTGCVRVRPISSTWIAVWRAAWCECECTARCQRRSCHLPFDIQLTSKLSSRKRGKSTRSFPSRTRAPHGHRRLSPGTRPCSCPCFLFLFLSTSPSLHLLPLTYFISRPRRPTSSGTSISPPTPTSVSESMRRHGSTAGA